MAIRPELVLMIAILTVSLVNVRRRRAAIGEHAARGGAGAAAAAAAALVKGSARAPPWKSRLPLRLKSQERMDSRKRKKEFPTLASLFKICRLPYKLHMQRIPLNIRLGFVWLCFAGRRSEGHGTMVVAVRTRRETARASAGDELTKTCVYSSTKAVYYR